MSYIQDMQAVLLEKDDYRESAIAVIPSCKENRLIRFGVITGERSGNCDNHPGSAL